MATVASSSFRPLLPIVAVVSLFGCQSIYNQPVNSLSLTPAPVSSELAPAPGEYDVTAVGLAFSGGGTRASAFSYGLLKQLQATPIPGDRRGRTMIDTVRFVSGVSGGSVTAAYFGLKGREGYGDLYEKFLIRDAEADMRTRVDPVSLYRAIKGGVNNLSTFGGWLDRNVFDGAIYSDLKRPGAPVIALNASDIYNGVPFVFNAATFNALCSNINEFSIADAVAASAAVPVVFSPVVLQAFGHECNYQTPTWVSEALRNPNTSIELKAFAQAIDNYRNNPELKYVKLVDGGITDNFGVTSIRIARAESASLYGPLTPREAVRLKRLLFIVADAGTSQSVTWAASVKGPSLAGLVEAVTNTSMESSVRDGYDAFRLTVDEWEADLVEYRCSLSRNEVQRLRGSLSGWDCRDIELVTTIVDFDDIHDAATKAKLEQIKTRLSLPTDEVNLAVSAGSIGLTNDPIFQEVLRSMGGQVVRVPQHPSSAHIGPTTQLMPQDFPSIPVPRPRE